MDGDGPKQGGAAAVNPRVFTEELTRLTREITRGANDTIAQLNGCLGAQQRIVDGYQAHLADANAKIASQQEEIAALKSACSHSHRLELAIARAELALKGQTIRELNSTLRTFVEAAASVRRPATTTTKRSAAKRRART